MNIILNRRGDAYIAQHMETSSRSNFSNIFLSVLILKCAKASPFSGLEPSDILTVLWGAFPLLLQIFFSELVHSAVTYIDIYSREIP
jgi:hypothetical protein